MSYQLSSRHKHEYLKGEYANSRILYHEMPVDDEALENDGIQFPPEGIMLSSSSQPYHPHDSLRHVNPESKHLIEQLTRPDPYAYLEREDEFFALLQIQQQQQQQLQQQQQQQQSSYILNTPQTPTSLPASPNDLYCHISPAIPSYVRTNVTAESSNSSIDDNNRVLEEMARRCSGRTPAELFYPLKTEDDDVEMPAWYPRVNQSSHSTRSPLVPSIDETRTPFDRKRKIEDPTDDPAECKYHRSPYVSPPDSPEMGMDKYEMSTPTIKSRRLPGGISDSRCPGFEGNNSTESLSSTTGKSLTCQECNRTFTRVFNLKTHINRVHFQFRNFVCTFVEPGEIKCERKFSAKGDLERHERIHTHKKPYDCKHFGCQEKFSRTEQRDRHHYKCTNACTDPECKHRP